MSHGGKRKGAGRPPGRGPWKEQTKPLRIPLSLLEDVTAYLEKRGYRLPMYASRIPAGTPFAPADAVERLVDLNALLLPNPVNCFLLKVAGDSMINVGIHDGDFLVVDRSVEPSNGKIVAAMLDGEATVKRFKRDRRGDIWLMPENDRYKPIPVPKDRPFSISGVVVSVLRRL